jgi:type II secretory pathway predicted ATPase ExeA
MYKEFFRLQKFPFNLTPDPAFLYMPPKHREAFAGLTYAVLERKGFVALTGDAGTGKTTLLSSVLNRLPPERILSSIILNPALTPSEFLEGVLLDFGITDVPTSKAQRLWRLQEFLLRAYEEDKIPVLIVDEAHILSRDVLEEIRLLGNYEYSSDKFLQILLLGQPELDDVLNRYDMRQLKQRISLRLYIDPLTPSEVGEYIRFRWTKAGAGVPMPFAPDAIAAVAQYSRGIARLVNSLCDASLMMACGDDCRSVGLDYVREAAINLAMVQVPRQPMAMAHAVGALAPEELHPARKLSPVEMPAPRPALAEAPADPHAVPTLSGYNGGRANSSWLKRLAGKFGAH